ncbi:MAG: CocE/NonD family hydrolase, partial [Phycisphaerae bacterium]
MRRWMIDRSGLPLTLLLILSSALAGCRTTAPTGLDHDGQVAKYLKDRYTKHEFQIPMRDGVRLFTAVYSPKDTSKTYPFLIFRTPYSCNPYGQDEFPSRMGSFSHLVESGFIFVRQDVRGRFMSEGQFVNMRPHIDNKQSPTDIDESSDTYDTIEWLIHNVPNNNGRAGMWGISYPGFYAAAGMIDAHPALKAVSPQAPIADWYFDDFHHHGAFFLPHFFGFFYTFGQARPEPTTEWGERFDYGTPDGYEFYMDLGPLKNIKERYYKDDIAYWDKVVAHPNRDAFWKACDILPHLHNVAPAVMTVGGWFDAEDLYGPLKIYRSVEEKNADIFNVLVVGPWRHGGWARGEGNHLGQVRFPDKPSQFYKTH